MTNFKKTNKEDFKIDPLKKNKHLRLKVFTILAMSSLMLLVGFLLTAILVEYKNTHTFKVQAPIIVRTPIVIKRNLTIVSPISTQSGMMKAYAEEVRNPFDPRSPKGIAWELVKNKWGIGEWGAYEELITQESGWNPYAVNQSSGACGIPQAYPCSKMNVPLWDYEGQIKWGIDYITTHGYGTPTKALEYHNENNSY